MSQFLIKPKIYFGSNSLEYLGTLEGRRAFVITDKTMIKFNIADKVCSLLQKNNIEYYLYEDVAADPDISVIVKGMKLMDENYPDLVIALGGGSVIDAAKAVIYSLWHCRKDTSRTKPCFVAIPTTSGTGSEVTSFSVIKAQNEKLVIVDEFMLPDITILDPALVASVPPAITADTGIDVLCHALEAYVSRNANDFTDGLAEKCIKLVFGHLIDCYQNGGDTFARTKMHNASCLAGMAFTNASLGITHSLAHALGGVFGIPHGRANALLLSQVVAFNADLQGDCNNQAAKKYAELARILRLPSNSMREGVTSLIVAINVLKEEMNIPANIQVAGITEHDFLNELDNLVSQSLRDICTPTNPRDVSAHDMETLYRHAFCGTALF